MNNSELVEIETKGMSSLSIMPTYWSPEVVGEKLEGYFLGFVKIPSLNPDGTPKVTSDGEEILIDCVEFAHQSSPGSWQVARNATRILVAEMQKAVENGIVKPRETGVRLEYLGKFRNKRNSFTSVRIRISVFMRG